MLGAFTSNHLFMDTKKNFAVSLLAGILGALIVVMGAWGFAYMNPNFFAGLGAGRVTEVKQYVASTSYEQQVIDTVKKASPSVVSVVITKDVPVLEKYYQQSGPFAFSFPQYRQKGTEKKEVGGGSGFVATEDGYIITNQHVVSESDAEYTVILSDGTKYPAKVVAKDDLNDIAVLKIEAKNLSVLQFANSDNLQVGQTVLAIGNPLLEFKNSVSVGVISGLSRSIVAGGKFGGGTEQLEGVIQTDAAINPGNSGGPLLNLNGEIVGMNVAMASAENIGFALPANLIESVVQSVKEHGKIIKPYLGIRYTPITKELKEKNKLSVDYGVLVLRGEKPEDLAVIPGSPADKAGIVENDIVLEIDGEKLSDDVSVARIVASKKVGDELKLKILHKGEEKEVNVVLEEFKE